MATSDDGLNAKQRKALDRFLAAHEEVADLERQAPRVREKRLKAIQSARASGVPTRVIIERSGLNQARIYQLFDQAKKAGEK